MARCAQFDRAAYLRDAMAKRRGPPHAPHGGFDAPGTFATWRKHLVAAQQYCPPHNAGKLVALILTGDPPKRRPQPTEDQLRRWRAGYVYPRGAPAADRIGPDPRRPPIVPSSTEAAIRPILFIK
jgi:hypothetical protein